MESVKKTIDERAHIKRCVWAVGIGDQNPKAGYKQQIMDMSVHVVGAVIRPIYVEESMVEVINNCCNHIFATGQLHTEQPEFNNEGKVDQNAEQCHDTCPLPA
ncbi:hypothetical protein Tco_0611323 [Tanacetum coccineum]